MKLNNRRILIILSILILVMGGYLGLRARYHQEEPKANQVREASQESIDVKVENVTESAVSEMHEKGAPTSTPKESKQQSDNSLKKEDRNKGDKKTVSPIKKSQPTKSPQSTKTPKPQKRTGTFTLTIDAHTVVPNMHRLPDSMKKYIPTDGIILPERVVTFTEGDTVGECLQKVCKESGIAIDLDTSWTGYVKGIANLYEKDLGNNSGWMYTVNGKYPNVGVCDYKVSVGDKVRMLYTCERGDLS